MTKSMEKKQVKQGEIWVANVNFFAKSGSKKRPVLALSLDIVGDDDIVILPISTSEARTDFDVKVTVEEGTGLATFPSYIRTSKPLTTTKRALTQKIGKLDEVDLANVLEKFRSQF
ncbi:hypothetical protein CN984_12220 [Bacillus cereus]|uniref:Uncharacterized protein n=1 Tax=Bacillus cereus TaxID=1396 RepID=A0A2A7FNH9_BACCE|nr:type II toxin-antitoxin system PemK/MazF family toxin [Bacillus cereus]PEA25817.1 hypothetical protein CON44_17875 [Bacillus cereus]PGO29202.1 hypothetical protein CN984_12220 [Bacillus cereus]